MTKFYCVIRSDIVKILGNDKVEKLELIKTDLIQKEGETAMITLVSAKDKEQFYKKFGFIERPNADRGAGMYMFHEKK